MKRQTWYDVKGSDTDDWDESSRPAIVELQYTYDNSHNVRRREDIRGDNSVGLATRDEQYEYDGLDRLATAQRGKRNHSTDAFTVAGDKGQDWSLDALGNWLSLKTDIDGDGDFDGSDREDARTFTLANEVVDQTLTNPNYPDELGFEFDDAGNQTGREVNPDQTGADGKWIYIYDAWNRLVEVRIDSDGDGSYDEVRVQYTYNGLHQRATRRANSNDQVVNGDDPGHLYYYDASWRLLEERIDEEWDGSNLTFASEKIVQRIWDPLYIDALIAMQVDTTTTDDSEPPVTAPPPDGDFTDGDIYYAVLDRKYDVIAMMSDAGVIRERVRYSPYGVARHQPGADITGDGMVNGTDQVTVLATWGAMGTTNYSAASDFDRDGDVDGADLSFLFANWSTTAEPEGVISRIGNTIGYSGYIYDDAINASLARFRWYDAELGRWGTRDPLEYVDGSSQYQFVLSNPTAYTDPFGLSAASVAVKVGAGGATGAAGGAGAGALAIAGGAVGGLIVGGGTYYIGDLLIQLEGANVQIAAAEATIAVAEASMLAYQLGEGSLGESAQRIAQQFIAKARQAGRAAACAAARASKEGMCKGSRKPSRCKDLPGIKCSSHAAKASHFMLCSAIRAAEVKYCNFKTLRGRKNHILRVREYANGATNCLKKFKDCMDRERQKLCDKSGGK